jgi:hypothetical protein
VDWYQRVLVDTGRAPAVWMLIGFLVTFAITRFITRRIHARAGARPGPAAGQPAPAAAEPGAAEPAAAEPGAAGRRGGLSDIYIGGVHIHHQVWGILLVLATGLLEFRYRPHSPWAEVLAALFGMGAALTLDEFALWFHLDDVYWTKSGRQSIDAILVGGALGAVLLLQPSLIGTASGHNPAAIAAYLLGVCFDLALAGVCIFKGKTATGLVGIIVPPLALAGAIRLAKPSSVWARKRYRAGRLGRAQRRFGPAYQRRHDRLHDLLGGRPDDSGSDPGDEPAAPAGQHPVPLDGVHPGPPGGEPPDPPGSGRPA